MLAWAAAKKLWVGELQVEHRGYSEAFDRKVKAGRVSSSSEEEYHRVTLLRDTRVSWWHPYEGPVRDGRPRTVPAWSDPGRP